MMTEKKDDKDTKPKHEKEDKETKKHPSSPKDDAEHSAKQSHESGHKSHHDLKPPSHPHHRKHEAGYVINEFSHCLASLKGLKSFKALIVASFDILFYLIIIGMTLLSSWIVTMIAEPLKDADPSMLMTKSAESLAQLQSSISRVVLLLLIIMIIYVLLSLAAFIFTRYLIWTTILEKKMRVISFLKFALLNLMWFAVIGLLMGGLISLFTSISSPVLLLVFSILAFIVPGIAVVYFTYIMYYLFVSTDKVIPSFTGAFVKGVKRFKRLWLPALLIILVFGIFSFISMLSNFMPGMIADIFVGLLLIIVATWIKIYAAEAIGRYVQH
ncbi:hypothetical protein GF345_02470 [Candidatus Woesearchaeota archaeon]|nr:hypothetical protein [Candidatus Woesearchaeota archaeon]